MMMSHPAHFGLHEIYFLTSTPIIQAASFIAVQVGLMPILRHSSYLLLSKLMLSPPRQVNHIDTVAGNHGKPFPRGLEGEWRICIYHW